MGEKRGRNESVTPFFFCAISFVLVEKVAKKKKSLQPLFDVCTREAHSSFQAFFFLFSIVAHTGCSPSQRLCVCSATPFFSLSLCFFVLQVVAQGQCVISPKQC